MTQPGENCTCPALSTTPREYRVIEIPLCACGNYAEVNCPACSTELCEGCAVKCQGCSVPHCLWCLFSVDDLLVCWREYVTAVAIGQESMVEAMEGFLVEV